MTPLSENAKEGRRGPAREGLLLRITDHGSAYRSRRDCFRDSWGGGTGTAMRPGHVDHVVLVQGVCRSRSLGVSPRMTRDLGYVSAAYPVVPKDPQRWMVSDAR
jgi:hypothetical protein